MSRLSISAAPLSGGARLIQVGLLLVGLVVLGSCSEDGTTAPPQSEMPSILGQDISDLDHEGVTLGGYVDGHGRSTVCWFDYGTDNTYGSRTPDIDAGSEAGSVRVEYRQTGLDPEQMHWWRMVAVAGSDTSFAADSTFVTLPIPNELPLTQATSVPHENNPVHFAWTGTDPDGEVAGFRWRISDNSAEGLVEADTLGLPWNFTTATDSVFWVTADLPGPRQPGDTGPRMFFRPHTFWIKAVDNLGAEALHAAQISFTATTEAPEVVVSISPSVEPAIDGCTPLALPISLSCAASDTDNPADEPLMIRTLLVSLSDLGQDSCFTQEEFENMDPLSSLEEALWGPWQEYDPQNPVPVTFEFEPEHEGKKYIFAAMALDAAGAWTDTFEWGVNVWQIEVRP